MTIKLNPTLGTDRAPILFEGQPLTKHWYGELVFVGTEVAVPDAESTNLPFAFADGEVLS
jgi:hypothetical protein